MEEIKEKSWFQRNWKWAVPVGGCGCGCIVLILIFVFGIGTAFFGVSKMFNESTPIKYATEQAFNHPRVLEQLGNDLEKTGIPSGNISLSNNDGEIDMSFSIKGLKGRGTVIVKGIKTNGIWAYEDLYVLIKDTQEQINLLEKTTEGF
ncbi:cytochrome c oxidase assembly factor Coa1 family protein [Polaribacter porphyrae]|uniref:Cytochrome oxidase complex assembly protein 1 n=1 Tax=Polaribacter porphyrae TaxID=1137780 RepID=A0A2S7WUA0_9FLAO|nr:cytochrome c oxidase assembly factor Coa1 family protein [Polaribacter porphyrae]PQJ81056.1 hypothetical protein BTO18_16645 [Polaribacter porphyrae]